MGNCHNSTSAKESDTLRLGLMSLSVGEKEVFIPHSDLQRLVQIQEGTCNISLDNM